jgi:hypothetical protein
MFCVRCGSPMQGAFCTHCGAPENTPPAAPPPVAHPPRVRQNLQTLGILWGIYAAYRGLALLFVLLFLFGIATPAFLHGMGHRAELLLPFAAVAGGLATLAAIFFLFSLSLAAATAYSLITRKPWGRILAIVAGILSLMEMPVGTGLGVFTLWVLAPTASGAEYDALANHT